MTLREKKKTPSYKKKNSATMLGIAVETIVASMEIINIVINKKIKTRVRLVCFKSSAIDFVSV
jgi:hypothetical protein